MYRLDVWLLTLKGKGYAAVVVMEFLGYGKRPSIFDFVLYHLLKFEPVKVVARSTCVSIALSNLKSTL
jgi:hypothetical protein